MLQSSGPEWCARFPTSRRLEDLVQPFQQNVGAFIVALRGGGSYDLVVRNEEAVILWALLGIGFAVGVLPVGRWTRAGWIYAGAMFALVAWTALAFLWTSSAERTTIELSRTAFYAGLVVLGLSVVNRKNRSALLGGVFAGRIGRGRHHIARLSVVQFQ